MSLTGGAGRALQDTPPVSSPMQLPLLLCTFLIVSMQLGFAMLEVGCVRQEHRMTVLAKNILDSMISSLSFAVACGALRPSIVLSSTGQMEDHLLMLHWAFLSTSVTLCSGAMAERTHLAAYLSYAVVMSGFVYPICADSAWGDGRGFLSSHFHESVEGHSYYDFSGGGVVHLAGGVAALVGNLLVGRRILRPPVKDFLPKADSVAGHEGKERAKDSQELLQDSWQRRFDNPEDDEREFRANSSLQVMGVFTLWVGCYGFNAAPAFLRGDASSVALAGRVAWNTSLAASAGALGAFLHQHLFRQRLDIGFLCNGLLSGLVASTAGCDVMSTNASVLVGFLAGFAVYPLGSLALRRLRLDDPADAIPVHAGSGLFSLLFAAFCRPDCARATHVFCTAGHHWGLQLLAQLRGALAIVLWTGTVIFPVWALFLLSETVRSMELQELVSVYERLCDHELGPPAKEDSSLNSAVQNSWVLRRLLGRYHGKFSAAALQELREDVLDAVHDTKTALEADGPTVRLFFRLADGMKRCRLLREVCRLRIRIPPFAELSGVGALTQEGGTVLEASRNVFQSVSGRSPTEASIPLRLQLEELTRRVQNQGVILQRLSRGRRHSGFRRSSLQSVAELPEPPPPVAGEEEAEALAPVRVLADVAASTQQASPSPAPPTSTIPASSAQPRSLPVPSLPVPSVRRGRSSLRSSEEHGDLSLLHVRSSTPEERPQRAQREADPPLGSHGSGTDRSVASVSTVSDKSMGLITPRSEGDETPPPMIYGRALSPSSLRGSASEENRHSAPDPSLVAAVAVHLANLRQAQQQLSTTLRDTRGEIARTVSAQSAQSKSTQRSSSFSGGSVALDANRSVTSISSDGTTVGMLT